MTETDSYENFQISSDQDLRENILDLGGEELWRAAITNRCAEIPNSLGHEDSDFAIARAKGQIEAGLEAGIPKEVIDLFIEAGMDQRNEQIRLGLIDSDRIIDPHELYGEDQEVGISEG